MMPTLLIMRLEGSQNDVGGVTGYCSDTGSSGSNNSNNDDQDDDDDDDDESGGDDGSVTCGLCMDVLEHKLACGYDVTKLITV